MSFGVNTFQQYSSDYGLGNNGVKICLNYFDGIPEQSLINSLPSAELKLIFKSLLKKDDTTKERALNDLLKLIEDPKAAKVHFDDDVFLLCWSQIYAKLISNQSKIVRLYCHQFTARLIKFLGKRIAKFLKDFVPLLLAGSFDYDSTVSKSCHEDILHCFNDNTEKVRALWSVFQLQTLNFVKEVVVSERQDTISDEKYVPQQESDLRYTHLITSAIWTLTRLLTENDTAALFESTAFYDILTCENLWSYLSLKKASNLKTYLALLQLLDKLTEVQYLKEHKEIIKLASKRFLKSLAHISSRNLLIVSPVFPHIQLALIHLHEYSEGKLWDYDRTSKEKLLNFLSLGPGNSDPSYYPLLFRLHKETNLPLNNAEWLDIWQKDIKIECKRKAFSRNAEKLLSESWKYYFKAIEENLQNPEDKRNIEPEIEREIFETLNEKPLQRYTDLMTSFSDFLSFDKILLEIKELLPQGKNEKHKDCVYIDNLITLCAVNPQNEKTLKEVAQAIFESIEKNHDDNYHYGFQIYDLFITSGTMSLNEEVTKFIYELPTFISESFYKLPSKIMAHYSNSNFLKETSPKVWFNYFNDFLIVFLDLNISKTAIISALDEFDIKVFDCLMHQSSELVTFTAEYINSFDFSDDLIFKTKFLNDDTLRQLYSRSLTTGNFSKFYIQCLALPSSLYVPFFEGTNFLADALFPFEDIDNMKLKDMVLSLGATNDIIAEKAVQAILAHLELSSEKIADSIVAYAVDLINCNSMVKDVLFPADIYTELNKHISSISYQVALTNPLGACTHLIHVSNDDFDLSLLRKFIRNGLFLDALVDKLPNLLDDDKVLLFTILNECGADYNSLSSEPVDYFQNFKNTIFCNEKYNFRFSEVVNAVVEPTSATSPLLGQLVASSSCSDVVVFYNCRILYRILSNTIDYVTLSAFDKSVSIDGYITDLVRDRNTSNSQLLLASTLFSSFRKFNTTSSSLVKAKTLLASELIGAKSNELVERTSKMIFLLNSMLQIEEDEDAQELISPIAPQRLRMILSDMNRWFDSDVYYEESFSVVRLSLLKFLHLLLKYPSMRSLGNSLFDPCMRLLSDSLDLCLVKETPYLLELRSYAVEFYKQLGQLVHGGNFDKEVWEEQHIELEKTFEEIIFTEFGSEVSNLCSFTFYQLVGTVIREIPTQTLSTRYSSLFDSFLSESTHNCNQTRMIVYVLRRLILSKQQELLIDYELKKSTGTSDVVEQDTFHLPEKLLSALNNEVPEDYLEYEDEVEFIQYLWCCFLTLTFFDEMSYNIRQAYIEELKQNDLLTKLFDFFSDQVDLTDNQFWSTVTKEEILEYKIQETFYTSYREDLLAECKKLLLHLMYAFFNSVGSATSMWWLNIKDRSRQEKIEKFVSRYISPILISQQLEEVATKMKRLTSQDQSLSIKINSVTNEIKASYLVDEQTLEISFKLPSNYPLNNIQVQGISRVGINEQKWKSWILSTQRVITGLNGSVIDSLELFTKNVNLHFSGFEECAICYSILHAVDRKLPSKTCPTCNNRFHGACLYKWFRSSGNNSCPMCRSEIPFRK